MSPSTSLGRLSSAGDRIDLAANIWSRLRSAHASPVAGYKQPGSKLITGIAMRGSPGSMQANETAASTQNGDLWSPENPDGGRQMLATALAEAQATVRAYDTKAQIVGVGYLFAMNLIAMVDKSLPSVTSRGIWAALVAWLIIIAPVFMFGNVLRPSRKYLSREANSDHIHTKGILYIVPNKQHTVAQLCDDARDCDPCREYASELLKVSKLREVKRSRFMMALYMATLSFVVLFGTHIFRAIQ